MTLAELFILSLALAADAFSVGAAVGLKHRRGRQIFRLSWHFGLFQSLMALAGWAAGHLLVEFIGAWDHWLAGGVLTLLGLRIIWEAVRDGRSTRSIDLTRGWAMLGLSVAVSIDALAAGIGLAALRVNPWLAIPLIGVVAGLSTVLSMIAAAQIGQKFGRGCGIVAGVILIILAVRIALTG